MASGASTSVTLNCGAGLQLNESKATEFIIALPPVLFSKGFKVTVTDADSKTYTTDTDKTNTVLRSSLLVMPELEIGDTAAQNGDYVDEYGINHGQGVKIGETVWAPVNCGYHATDYAYGKLYQWGRKYGQGYSGNLYGINGNNTGTISDSTVPTLSEGGVSEIGGNHKSNANVFYYGSSDWVDPRNDMLWNLGSESNPAKTDYDPCPKGWRIPTYAELAELCQNHSSWTSKDGQNGCWFSGASSYTEGISQVFFPAAGWRDYYSGNALTRGNCGTYLSSRPTSYGYAYHLRLRSGNIEMNNNRRANGYSVRCVQE